MISDTDAVRGIAAALMLSVPVWLMIGRALHKVALLLWPAL